MSEKLCLAEEPHLVIQGEGNLIGKKMLLLRVSGCNIKCRDCDSPHTWKQSDKISYDMETLTEFLHFQQGFHLQLLPLLL
jgi:organic radical activating enzyme